MTFGNQPEKRPGTGGQSTSEPAGTTRKLDESPRGDLILILVLLAIFLFHSPFTHWWSSLGLPWYSIFVFWLLLIVLLAVQQSKKLTRRKTGTDSGI